MLPMKRVYGVCLRLALRGAQLPGARRRRAARRRRQPERIKLGRFRGRVANLYGYLEGALLRAVEVSLLTRPLVGAGALVEDRSSLSVGNRVEDGLVVLGQGGPRRGEELKQP